VFKANPHIGTVLLPGFNCAPTMSYRFISGLRGEFRPRQTRQLPMAVDSKVRFLFLVVVRC
jgi:hypothetical protein